MHWFDLWLSIYVELEVTSKYCSATLGGFRSGREKPNGAANLHPVGSCKCVWVRLICEHYQYWHDRGFCIVSITNICGNFQLDRNPQSEVRSKNRWLLWSPGMRLPLRGPLHRVAWPSDYIVHWFHNLEFCSVSFNETLALVGRLWKILDRASISSVPMSALPIHTCKSQRHACFLLRLAFPS